jgi:hypothetical protein
MQVSQIFTSNPRLALVRAHARTILEQKMSIGDHDIAIGEAGLPDGGAVRRPRHLDRGAYSARPT